MASSSSILSEEQCHCSICLDVFTNPVSLPCGHNFCMACIRSYWQSSALFQCPMCKKTFYKQPDISINTVLKEIAEQFKEMRASASGTRQYEEPTEQMGPSSEVPCDVCAGDRMKAVKSCLAHLKKTEAEVHQMVLDRLKKMEEIQQSVELSKCSAQREIEDSVQVFTNLIRAIQQTQAELIGMMEEKQRTTERKAEYLIKELEKEITELQKRNTDLEKLSHTEDHIHFLQSFPSLCTRPHTKNWSDITVYTDLPVGTIRRAVSRLEETISEEMEKLADMELKKIQKYSANVTFDPNTANPWLMLSDDGKQLKHGGAWQDLPNEQERFDTVVIVLGKEGLTSGRHYWEVQVGEKDDWYLGVARASVKRKGRIAVSTAHGYWALAMKKGQEYRVSSTPPILLPLDSKPRRVGVYVDYEEGQVSFYNVKTRSHIYTFMDTFTEKLFPFFYLYCCDKASDTMIICSGR